MEAKERKRRAVRLSEHGLETLNARLVERFERYAEEYPRAKLTREVSAELLGLSARTVGPLLRRGPVDRSTVMEAFRMLEVPWKEAFCEEIEPSSGSEPAEQALTEVQPKAKGIRYWLATHKLTALAGFAVLAFSVGFLIKQARQPTDTRPDWQIQFQEKMIEATSAYHRADYSKAWTLQRAAALIAHRQRDVADIAYSLQLEGQLLAAAGKDEEALQKFENAKTELQTAGFSNDLYHSTLELGAEAKLRLGKLSGANEDYLECLGQAQKEKSRVSIAAAFRGLGSVAYAQKLFPESVKWFDEGLSTLINGEEADMACDIRARRSLAVCELGRFDEALSTLNSCLAHWKAKGHPRWIATSEYQLGLVWKKKGDAIKSTTLLTQARSGYGAVGDQGGVLKCDELLASDVDKEHN